MTGIQTVQDPNQPAAGATPATPAPSGQNPPEDPATEAARLRKENKDLADRLAQKDTHIGELSTVNATLEQRLSGFQATRSVVDPATPEADPATPPARGGTPVSQLAGVRAEDIPEIIERTTFINKVKDENKDMIDLGLEPIMEQRADQLIRQGKPFKEAILTAVKEQREKFEKIKQPSAPPAQPPATGVRAEEGAPANPTPAPVVTTDTLDDEGEGRRKARALKGL